MNKQEQQTNILGKIEAMVDAWNRGDTKESQGHYEYILGWCESAGYDFCGTMNGGIDRLIALCVGIEDTKKYTKYLKGISNYDFE